MGAGRSGDGDGPESLLPGHMGVGGSCQDLL